MARSPRPPLGAALEAAFDRFIRTGTKPAPVESEPDAVDELPPDGLLRLALILEPFSKHVVHYRDARAGDLYCGRPSIRGNPHRAQDPEDETARLECIREYARDFAARSGRQQAFMLGPVRRTLRSGSRLVCWCSPRTCHAQVLAAWAFGRRILPEELETTA